MASGNNISKGVLGAVFFIFIFTVLFSSSVFAVPPYLLDINPGHNFYATQDSRFEMIINATDPDGAGDYPLTFSDSRPNGFFESFEITGNYNATAGIINFTPDRVDVGSHIFFLNVEDQQGYSSGIEINFTVLNINDAPIIDSTNPSQIIYTKEANKTYLEMEILDYDIPDYDTLNYYWYINGTNATEGSNALVFSFDNTTNRTNATYQPGYFDMGVYNITLVVNDSYLETINYSWLVDVSNNNRAPIFYNDIVNVTLNEDSIVDSINNRFNLTDHFFDPDTNGTNRELDTKARINYSVVLDSFDLSGAVITTSNINENITNVSIGEDIDIIFNYTGNINETIITYYPRTDYSGNHTVNFTVDDGINLTVGNSVKIEVLNSNDAPVLSAIPDNVTYAYAEFNYTVNVTDPDNSSFIYSDNSTLFNINISTGNIYFVPDSGDVGNHTINISVSDGEYIDWDVFVIEILPNIQPTIFGISNQSMSLGDTLQFYFGVGDADAVPDNSTLIVTSDTPLLDSIITIGPGLSDNYRLFSIHPINRGLIDNHTVRLYIHDEHGGFNYTEFNLEINDSALVPYIFPLDDYSVRIGKEFVIDLVGNDTDADSGNVFKTNVSFLPVNTDEVIDQIITGDITYTAYDGYIGLYVVNASLNDSQGNVNWTLFDLNITLNNPPVFNNPPTNISQMENTDCNFDFTANDTDYQDMNDLNYGHNSTHSDFYINPTTGYVNFTVGYGILETVNIWVVDGYDANATNVSIDILLNITPENDPPYFNPEIYMYSEWNSSNELDQTYFYVTATDEEGHDITFDIDFINFTQNLTGIFDPNPSNLFTFTDVSRENANDFTALVNFTPADGDAGIYWVNASLSDGNVTNPLNWTVFSFDIRNRNDLAVANWTVKYNDTTLNGDSLFTTTEFIDYQEGEYVEIYVSYSDPDLDIPTVDWSSLNMNSEARTPSYTNANNLTFVNYTIRYTDSPQVNLTLKLTDNKGLPLNVTFIINSTNMNRPPTFGSRALTDFSGGSRSQLSLGSLLLANNSGAACAPNPSCYYTSGTYTSELFDMDIKNYESLGGGSYIYETEYEFTNLTYDASIPLGSDILFTMSSKIGDSLQDNWYNVTNNIINDSKSGQYYKLGVELRTTDTSITPVLREVAVNYEISDRNISEGAFEAAMLNIDSFFNDIDNDDVLIYTPVTANGADIINATIDNSTGESFLSVEGIAVGVEEIYIIGTDGYNNVTSNSFNITVFEAEEENEESSSSSSRSSSSSTKTITQTLYKEIPVLQPTPEYISLDIIHPEDVSIYDNNTIDIPITLKNSQNFSFKGLGLAARVNQQGIDLKLEHNYIDEIEPGGKFHTMLTANMSKVYGKYEIFVEVNSTEPVYNDTAKILISTLKRDRKNEDVAQMKLTFAKDLVKQNPECLEFKEFLNRAETAAQNKKYDETVSLVDDFVSACSFLVGNKDKFHTENPKIDVTGLVTSLIDDINSSRNARYISIAGIIIFLSLIGFYTVAKYKQI